MAGKYQSLGRVTFHLASSQEAFHASVLPLEDPANLDYALPTHVHPPIKAYTYPFVSHSPPFPFSAEAPVSVTVDKLRAVNDHLRSANNLSLTRTLETLKRYLGPHFNLEKLWDMHTYYEFVERNASSRSRYFLARQLSKRQFRNHDHNGQTSLTLVWFGANLPTR